MPKPNSPTHRPGFTLVELLVVIAIIGILVALLLPAVRATREAARRTQCLNHLKQIGLGIHNFESARGKVIPAYLTGTGHATWMVLILPYMELTTLHDKFEKGRTFYVQPSATVQTQVPHYYCPSRTRTERLSLNGNSRGGATQINGGSLTDYAFNGGDGLLYSWWGNPVGAWHGVAASTHRIGGGVRGTFLGSSPTWTYSGWKAQLKFRDISDGLSNTLLVGEKFVHPEHQGIIWDGDGACWSDDGVVGKVRVAGPQYPLARSDTDPTVVFDSINMAFGGPHPGISSSSSVMAVCMS